MSTFGKSWGGQAAEVAESVGWGEMRRLLARRKAEERRESYRVSIREAAESTESLVTLGRMHRACCLRALEDETRFEMLERELSQ